MAGFPQSGVVHGFCSIFWLLESSTVFFFFYEGHISLSQTFRKLWKSITVWKKHLHQYSFIYLKYVLKNNFQLYTVIISHQGYDVN